MAKSKTKTDDLAAVAGAVAAPAEPAAPPVAVKSLRELGIQSFDSAEIDRRRIKNAEYNPRTITADAKRRLKNALKKLGLLGPIIWNVRTGNIVGGHQRLSIIDGLVGAGQPTFTLTVAQVDLDEKQEVEANLLLNNDAAMGSFDLSKLESLMKMPGLDITAAGWEPSDVYRLFGTTESVESEQATERVAGSIKELSDKYKLQREESELRDSPDFYLVVVFKSYEARKAFTDARGLEDNRYQSAEAFEKDA